MPKTLAELIHQQPGVLAVTGDTATRITAPVVESDADVQPGGVFVARRGGSVDGHDFIPRAIERGAAAVVGEKEITDLPVPYVRVENAMEITGYLSAAYHDYPSRKLVIIGVTGTDGKTTTSTLIHSILQVATGGDAGLVSTVNAVLGASVADTGLHVTTPGAPQVQDLLAQMVANGLTHCVLEMTSHGLAQGRLNGVDIDIAVLTNITHEHLDYHGSFEAYRAAKGRMFQMFDRNKPHYNMGGFINADDPNAAYFEALCTAQGVGIWRYGLDQHNISDRRDFYIKHLQYHAQSTEFDVYRDKDAGLFHWAHIQSPLVGEFNVRNILAACSVAYVLRGMTSKPVEQGVMLVQGIPGRMERIDEGQNFTAIVDFAHTPNALENALNAGRTMLQPGKRLIAVFGSAGLRDREKRRLMAEVSARLADITVLTAEDPRTESLDGILEIMAKACVSQGGVERETFFRVPDRGAALYRACQLAQPGDIVMACGKGHEQSMCFGTVEYPWDDREALRAALRGTPLRTLPTAENER
ncbi:MAG: UDP-N-acetylmuramoyl-L-alanyl-D-glutamate--2,6-diaminopimelate ligase [Anaerolineaceae bacterium]|nr:UDP-N-acetylmuramoyl-L-alanyl-D-glutamate--2,6-diaminopimelate ligase [Anaerolineaceae bacterium]